MDVSPLVRDGSYGSLADPMLDNAGKDVTHWFSVDRESGAVSLRTRVDPETNLVTPYTPHGRFIHVPPRDPTSTWRTDFGTPWWCDTSLVVGRVTLKERHVWIVNTLTSQRHYLSIGSEETVAQLQERFLEINAHAGSYTWKAWVEGGAEGSELVLRTLDASKTLAENGLADEEEELLSLGLDPEQHLPEIQIYFNDDLTIG